MANKKQVADISGDANMDNYIFRYYQKIKDGFFGNDVFITVHEGYPSGWPTVSGYCFRKEMVPGGVLYDNGIHTCSKSKSFVSSRNG
mgnify:CR=1 FL=1